MRTVLSRLLGLAGLLLASFVALDADRPNIVLIMTDDLGFSDIGSYGGEIDTPNLDRLAAGGVRFQQFYNTSKCAQTRATLLSGRYFPEVAFLPPHKNSVTIAEVMRNTGYHTLMSGKWHLSGDPIDNGWDRYFGHLAGAVNFFTGVSSKGDMTFMLDGQPWLPPAEGFYTTDAMTDFALQFLAEENDPADDQPFLLYLAYNAPHYPLHAKEPDVAKYRHRYAEGWDVLRQERHQRQLALGIIPADTPLSPRPADVPAWSELEENIRQEHVLTMAAYAGMVDSVDQNLGRIIQHLENTGEFDNTLFLFMSDNGGCPFQRTYEETREQGLMPWDPHSYWTYDKGWAHASNTPFRWYKQNQHEGGISSPFIVHWADGLGGKSGRIVRGPGHLIDIAATLYDIVDADYPATIDDHDIGPLRGHTLLPILAGEFAGEPREYWHQFRGNRALRRGDWKIAVERSMDPDAWELFNIAEDRAELHDLSTTKPVLRQTMIDRYWQVDAEIKANMPARTAVDADMH